MVSFQCDACSDVIKKPKLKFHQQRCHATFTCIDCSTTFQGNSWQQHNSCITEAEKYQGALYKKKGAAGKAAAKQPSKPAAQAPAPAKAPVSLIAELKQMEAKKTDESDKKRTSDTADEKPKKKSKKEKKSSAEQRPLTEWSDTEMENDLDKSLALALQKVLKDGKSHTLSKLRRSIYKMHEKHPKMTATKDTKQVLKKRFDEAFQLRLENGVIVLSSATTDKS